MKKDIRAFTLIELLAIIVILAIIAVITTPIILNVIENAKKGAIIDSTYGYNDSIQKYYLTKLSEDSEYTLGDGIYSVGELKELGMSVSGQEPTEGWLELEKGQVIDYSLKFNDYVVNYDESTDSIVIIKNGDVEASFYYNYYGIQNSIQVGPTSLDTSWNYYIRIYKNNINQKEVCAVSENQTVCFNNTNYDWNSDSNTIDSTGTKTQNLKSELESKIGLTCDFNSGNLSCYGDSVNATADVFGGVSVYDDDCSCYITNGGNIGCNCNS